MKTILWATLTANGNYAQSSPDNPPKREALEDFARRAQEAGNFIVGRRTFEEMQDPSRVSEQEIENDQGPFASLDIVVLTSSVEEIPGVKVVKSPEEALAYLKERGHTSVLLSGGANLHNAFLGAKLADEIIFNIAPVLEGKGLNLLIDQASYQYKHIELLDSKPIGNGVVQLHYGVSK